MALLFSAAAPTVVRASPAQGLTLSVSGGIGTLLPLRGDEDGVGLQLGGDFAQGPHWFELRHAWFFHPGLAYMTSVDREAAILYGHSLGMSRLHGCIGFGLYEDYATPGVQAGFRLDLTHAGLEAYWVRKDYPALGIGFTLKTGDLLGD